MSRETSPKGPFTGFVELGDGQWHRPGQAQSVVESSASLSATPATQPDLIMLCTWASARHKHIAKYLVRYQALYPQSDILLLESSMANLSWKSDTTQMRSLRHTLNAIKEILRSFMLNKKTRESSREPIVLVHAFSNGGAYSIVQLAQAYHEHMAAARTQGANPWARTDLPAELPVSALILDSSPGRADYDVGVKVVQTSIPTKTIISRLLVTLVAHVVISSIVVAHKLGIAENIASKAWRCLNDINGPFLVKKEGEVTNSQTDGGNAAAEKNLKIVPRTYIYSTRDDMVPWQGVLEHAEEARHVAAEALTKAGIGSGDMQAVIGLEGFSGSAHVNHMLLDSGRYWKLVRETVEKIV